MYKETDGQLGDKPKVVVEIDDEGNSDSDNVIITSPSSRQRRKSSDGGRRKSASDTGGSKDKKRKKSPAPPSKSLDDMFRKTKAQPAIYWLPLTDEEVVLISLRFLFP